MSRSRIVILFSLSLLLTPVLRAADAVAYTAVPPLATVLQSIGGDRWAVKALIGEGQDPHTLSLTPSMASSLMEAKLYFGAGMEIEDSLLSRLPAGGPVRIPAPMSHEDSEAEDPHIWLDPAALSIFAQSAVAGFSAADPEHADEYTKNAEAFTDRLHDAEGQIVELLAPYQEHRFYVQHGAFEHFAEAFGIEQVALEEHGREPSPKRIASFSQQAREEKVAVVYAQPGQNPAPLQRLAESIGAKVGDLDPLPSDPVEGMIQIAKTLAGGFSAQEGQQ